MVLFIKTKVDSFKEEPTKFRSSYIKVFPELKTSSTNITTLSSISSEDKLQVMLELYGLSLSKLTVSIQNFSSPKCFVILQIFLKKVLPPVSQSQQLLFLFENNSSHRFAKLIYLPSVEVEFYLKFLFFPLFNMRYFQKLLLLPKYL